MGNFFVEEKAHLLQAVKAPEAGDRRDGRDVSQERPAAAGRPHKEPLEIAPLRGR
jgi:hypothetical protein